MTIDDYFELKKEYKYQSSIEEKYLKLYQGNNSGREVFVETTMYKVNLSGNTMLKDRPLHSLNYNVHAYQLYELKRMKLEEARQ